jgi:hypothetical protein
MSRTALVLMASLLLCLPNPVIAQTAEALAAADRLIVVQNLDAMMNDMADKVAKTLPGATEQQKRAFIAEMTSPAFLERYKTFTRIALAKHMTVEELNALSDFYSKPIAISAMKKMGATMAEIMPFIQAEIPNLVARVMKAQ